MAVLYFSLLEVSLQYRTAYRESKIQCPNNAVNGENINVPDNPSQTGEILRIASFLCQAERTATVVCRLRALDVGKRHGLPRYVYNDEVMDGAIEDSRNYLFRATTSFS